MIDNLSRRQAIAMMAGATVLRGQAKPFTFGFSLYGMQKIPVLDGIGHCARIGYKAVELCLRPGWNTEPKLLTKASRAEIRKRIADLGLVMPSVMENIRLAAPGGNLQTNLDRLKAAAEVAYETSPGEPALIETTVGGRPDSWEQIKNAMAEELRAWGKTLEGLRTTLAIKAHSKTAMSLPERAVWLEEQAKSPRIKLVYDYSHYVANGLDMKKTMQQVASRAVFVHIKDTVGKAPNHKFVLPGDGSIDYKAYLKTLGEVGYRGPVIVEVSVDVFGQPGYDGVVAAQHVWDKVSPAFAQT